MLKVLLIQSSSELIWPRQPLPRSFSRHWSNVASVFG